MDTMQNISSVIVGGSNPTGSRNSPQHAGNEDVENYYASSQQPKMVVAQQSQQIGLDSQVRKLGRREFLSRPNWLFTQNENILFCTALNALRFEDQNNVPRKFIEEWLSERMVKMDTEWYAGNRFLNETMNDFKKEQEKFLQKKLRIWKNRQKGFYERRQQNLSRAVSAYSSRADDYNKQQLDLAKAEAAVPMEELNPPEPTIAEVALEELQTKIIRRLQGQTDRLDMAEHLAHKPYEGPNQGYFERLQLNVLEAIKDKHAEICLERDQVENKSKQSRKRRRNQVPNGVTMSGSATRVRFTNREIAMLIHWVYTWPKEEWSARIAEFYSKTINARSVEHVRDKIRDLINRSKDQKKGGLSSVKARVTGSYFNKPNEPPALRELAINDLQDFSYPSGVLEQVPGGRYFNEERGAWTDGPLPADYIRRYHEEIQRLRNAVHVKIIRNVDRRSMSRPIAGMHDPSVDATGGNEVYDSRLVTDPGLAFGSALYSLNPSDADYAMAKNLQASTEGSGIYWNDQDQDHTGSGQETSNEPNNKLFKGSVDDMTAIASAALKPGTSEYLQLEREEHSSEHTDAQSDKDVHKSKMQKR